MWFGRNAFGLSQPLMGPFLLSTPGLKCLHRLPVEKPYLFVHFIVGLDIPAFRHK